MDHSDREFFVPHPIYDIEVSQFGRFKVRINQSGKTRITKGGRKRRAGYKPSYEYVVHVQPRGTKNKKESKHKQASHLVLEAFLCSKYDDKVMVDHIDRNSENNCIDNLRWANYFDNNRNRGGRFE